MQITSQFYLIFFNRFRLFTAALDTFQKSFSAYLKKTISIRDTFVPNAKKEIFYHGILLGLLSHREEWSIQSNVESKDGFSDILILDEETETGIVIEVKYGENEKLDQGCRQALKQIGTNHYAERLIDDGMHIIFKYGLACYKKQCKILLGDSKNNPVQKGGEM